MVKEAKALFHEDTEYGMHEPAVEFANALIVWLWYADLALDLGGRIEVSSEARQILETNIPVPYESKKGSIMGEALV